MYHPNLLSFGDMGSDAECHLLLPSTEEQPGGTRPEGFEEPEG